MFALLSVERIHNVADDDVIYLLQSAKSTLMGRNSMGVRAEAQTVDFDEIYVASAQPEIQQSPLLSCDFHGLGLISKSEG